MLTVIIFAILNDDKNYSSGFRALHLDLALHELI